MGLRLRIHHLVFNLAVGGSENETASSDDTVLDEDILIHLSIRRCFKALRHALEEQSPARPYLYAPIQN